MALNLDIIRKNIGIGGTIKSSLNSSGLANSIRGTLNIKPVAQTRPTVIDEPFHGSVKVVDTPKTPDVKVVQPATDFKVSVKEPEQIDTKINVIGEKQPALPKRTDGFLGEVIKSATPILQNDFFKKILNIGLSNLDPKKVTPEGYTAWKVGEEGTKPYLEKFFEIPVVKESTKAIARETTGSSLKARVQSLSPDKTYKEAFDAIKKDQEENTNSFSKQFLSQLGETAPQTLIGVVASFIPYAGQTLSTAYWTSISASEQMEGDGKVSSITKLGLDVIGDRMLGNSIEGLLKMPSKSLLNTMIQGFGVEGGTEVMQDLGKFQTDYLNAKTTDEKQSVINEVVQYIKSGQILITLGVGGVTGAGISGVANVGQKTISPGQTNITTGGQADVSLDDKRTVKVVGQEEQAQEIQVNKQIEGQEILNQVKQEVEKVKPDIKQEVKTQDPLIQEAKKYKSAEEFVKANKEGGKGIEVNINQLKTVNEKFDFEYSGISKEGRAAVDKYKKTEGGLIKISPLDKDGKFFVEDGVHRVQAAIELGKDNIKARININESQLTDIWNKAQEKQALPKAKPTVEGQIKPSVAPVSVEKVEKVETPTKEKSEAEIKAEEELRKAEELDKKQSQKEQEQRIMEETFGQKEETKDQIFYDIDWGQERESGYQNFKQFINRSKSRAEIEDYGQLVEIAKEYNTDADNTFFSGANEITNDELFDKFKERYQEEVEQDQEIEMTSYKTESKEVKQKAGISTHYEKIKDRFGLNEESIEYKQLNNKETKKKAFDYIQRSPDKAMKIAHGIIPNVSNIPKTNLLASLAASLNSKGNVVQADEVARLLSKHLTETAQELQAAKANLYPKDKPEILKNITDARLQKIGEKLGEVNVEKAIEEGKKEVKKQTQKAGKEVSKQQSETTIQELDSFIKSILC